MTKKKVTVVFIGTDDIYFIIGNKQTSVLKLMSSLERKINRYSLGAWAALGLGILSVLPAGVFQLALIEIKEQSELIEKQSETIQKLSDRLIVVETELKNK